jgi:hypothetical protein
VACEISFAELLNASENARKTMLHSAASALSNIRFWVTSFPRRRETSTAIWILAYAGMTVNPNFMTVNPNFKL